MLQISIDKLRNSVIVALLFFAAMNFQAKFFYFVFAAIALLILFQRKIRFPLYATPYFGLGVLMAFYNSDEGILSMLRCFAFFALYLVGYNFVTVSTVQDTHRTADSVEKQEKICTTLLVTMAVGSFTHYMLNFIVNMGKSIGRNTIDIWSGEIMAATGQATIACIMMGLAVAFFILPPKKGVRYLGLLCIFLILAYNFVLAGRTLVILLFILCIIGAIFFRYLTPSVSTRYKTGFAIALSLLIVLVLLLMNAGGILDAVMDSNFFERFGQNLNFESNRSDAKLNFLSNAWRYPFGGLHLRENYGYAHDLLLDGYDEYGILGLLLLIIILLRGFVSLFRTLQSDCYGREFRMQLLCIYSAILLTFFVEPILAGMPWILVCYSMINGCLDGINYCKEGITS